MATKKKCVPTVENGILDLPELALECILGKLTPTGLCNMASVCSSLRDRCRSDHLWERHMKEKWGRVIGSAARRKCQWYFASMRSKSSGGFVGWTKSRKSIGTLACFWTLSWPISGFHGGSKPSSIWDDSIMLWYLSLERGRFWFPAQVYNREHGHEGFLLSCYDAELCYDFHTDTFQARYPPHGPQHIVIEEGVQWDMIRAPSVDTSAHDLHVSDCLNDLRPGDHIEIQWRRNKEFPYDTINLEFNQYTPDSSWRRASISRKDHHENGNETYGFYGGIRKLHDKDEISTWKRLWPTEVLE